MKYVRFDGEIIIDVYYEGTEHREHKTKKMQKTSNIVEKLGKTVLFIEWKYLLYFLNVSQMN